MSQHLTWLIGKYMSTSSVHFVTQSHPAAQNIRW